MANNSITGITVCTCKTCGSQWEALCAADVVDTCHECQKEAGLTVDRKPQMQMRKCAQCGKDFSPLQPEFEFCPTCFKAGARLCRTCGGAFIPAKPHFRDCPRCHSAQLSASVEQEAKELADHYRSARYHLDRAMGTSGDGFPKNYLYGEERDLVEELSCAGAELFDLAQATSDPMVAKRELTSALDQLNAAQVVILRAQVDQAVSDVMEEILHAETYGVRTPDATDAVQDALALIKACKGGMMYTTVQTLRSTLKELRRFSRNLAEDTSEAEETAAQTEDLTVEDEKEPEPPTPEEVEDKETVEAAEEAIETAAAGETDGGKKKRRTRRPGGRGKQKDPSPEETNEEAFETQRAQRAAEEETLIQEARTIWNGGEPNQKELSIFLSKGKRYQDAMAKVLESDKAEGLCPSLQSLSVA